MPHQELNPPVRYHSSAKSLRRRGGACSGVRFPLLLLSVAAAFTAATAAAAVDAVAVAAAPAAAVVVVVVAVAPSRGTTTGTCGHHTHKYSYRCWATTQAGCTSQGG
jgi:hypothetical protein